MLLQFFQSLKLTAKEQAILLRLLALGYQPASAIARHVEMPRNTVRSILDGLVQRGLLVRTRRGHAQYYAVESPENIDRMLLHREERTKKEVSEQRSLLEASRSELLAWSKATSRPRVTFYEGWSGLEKAYEDSLTTKEGLRAWASFDANTEAMPEYFKTYYLRRAGKGIHMTSIHPDTPLAREHHKRADKEYRTSALVPKKAFNIGPEIQMYDNKVNIVSWKDKLGILIESQEIADAMKAVFALSFEAARTYRKVTRPRAFANAVARPKAKQ